MTPVRKWIKHTLRTRFPNPGTVWSNGSRATEFRIWTGVNHDGLLRRWFKDGDPDSKEVGFDPGFSTCTGFLAVFANSVRNAGHISLPDFQPFRMPNQRGWSPAWLMEAAGGPQEGDFYLTTDEKGAFKHVGIIFEIQGTLWSVVGGGAGGRSHKRDGVKRTPLERKPDHVLGYTDVDYYYEGWRGPNI